MMSAIRSRNTRPERKVRSALHAEGYRFRVHAKWLPGTPDLAFTKRHVAVFVHGCFWHSHDGCSQAQLPKTRTDYWAAKLQGNRQRDVENSRLLSELGWEVAVVWECEKQDLWLARLRSLLGPPRYQLGSAE